MRIITFSRFRYSLSSNRHIAVKRFPLFEMKLNIVWYADGTHLPILSHFGFSAQLSRPLPPSIPRARAWLPLSSHRTCASPRPPESLLCRSFFTVPPPLRRRPTRICPQASGPESRVSKRHGISNGYLCGPTVRYHH